MSYDDDTGAGGWPDDDYFDAPLPGDIKTQQLCRQVEEAIAYALACSTSALLRDLVVASVKSVRGAAVLCVRVAMDDDDADFERTEAALHRASGYLRSEVAHSIHRKRVPTLKLVLVPPSGRT